MDGTLLNSDKHLSDENKHWIHRARASGIEATIATGRHKNTILEPYARKLQIRIPIVTMNGSQIIRPDGTPLFQHQLAASDIEWMHQLAEAYETEWLAFTTAQGMNQSDVLTSRLHDGDDTWLKFVYRCRDMDTLQALRDQLEQHGGFELSSAEPLNVEVNPAGIHKAFGLQYVCEQLGISPHEVIAIGDGLNDIKMLKWAGLGIAMGNAPDEVKQVADLVTYSCEDSGVAKAIQRILE